MGLYVEQNVNHNFPMIPHLFLTSAREDTQQIWKKAHVNV
jgi:hypothetical protein